MHEFLNIYLRFKVILLKTAKKNYFYSNDEMGEMSYAILLDITTLD